MKVISAKVYTKIKVICSNRGIILDTFFSQDQIENLKSWKNSLQTEVALSWKVEEDKAEEQIHALLESKQFSKEGILTQDELNLMFHLMRNFSANRALSKLLYINNGLEELNKGLKDLFYGDTQFPKRVDNFFKLKGIGTQTLSQFLIALDSKKFPLITSDSERLLIEILPCSNTLEFLIDLIQKMSPNIPNRVS